MHDFYTSHLHQGHMPPTHASSVTPPHQIHNPTPSYPPPHSSMSTLNSPSSYTSPIVSSSLLSEPNQNITRNESPNSVNQYTNSMVLPPTPNSLVTMIGPNSNNSNSNEASSTPIDNNIDTIGTNSTSHNNNNHQNSHYSPWTHSGSSIRPPLSPDASSGILQPLSNGVNGQMHHISSASSLQHTNQVSSFMPQSLHPFSHHSQVSKNFGMAPQYYSAWY